MKLIPIPDRPGMFTYEGERMKLKIGERIECPFCKATATKPPSRPVEDYPIWALPTDSPLKKLEEQLQQAQKERDALVRAWYECPQDSVPEVLDDIFQDIELADIRKEKATRKQIEDEA